jgi:hypothetical protein
MYILNSKWFSLLCVLLNVVFAVKSFAMGGWLMCALCSTFAIICYSNFYKQHSLDSLD